MKDLCRELAQEHAALDEIVKGIGESKWDMITLLTTGPSDKKFVISHILMNKARLAATDPDGFQTDMLEILEGVTSVDEFLANTVKDLMKFSSKSLNGLLDQ